MNKKDFIILLITMTIVAVVWVAGSLSGQRQQVQVSPKLQEAMQPVNPDFDRDTLNKVNTLATDSFSLEPAASTPPAPTGASSAASLKAPTFTSLPNPSPVASSTPSASPVL